METLADIAVFCRVVDSGSFTAAAGQLGVSRTVVSKYITRLEARLGARLLNRTTRRLSLTEAGATLFEASRGALGLIEEAELQVSRLQVEPRGMLKVSAPMSFAILHIVPALSDFLAGHPAVSVDLKMDDRMVDVVDEGFDLAIRVSSLKDSSLVARRLAPCRFVVCGSPDYLARRGTPRSPEDLSKHNFIVYTYGPRANVVPFVFADGPELAVPISGNLRVNNGIVQRDLALFAGLGLTTLPTFYVGDVISEGRLQPVLTEFELAANSVYAVYPERKYLAPKVRAFIDFLAQRFGPEPYWDRFMEREHGATIQRGKLQVETARHKRRAKNQ